MTRQYILMAMNDAFYQEYRIPSLPFPIKEDILKESLQIEQISFTVLADNLQEYLEDHPEDLEKYKTTLTTISYYAGVWEKESGRQTNAYRYLKMAKKYGYIKNISIITEYAQSCLMVGELKEAISEYEFAYYFIKDKFFPMIWVMLAICYHLDGDEGKGNQLLEELFQITKQQFPFSYEEIYKMANSRVEVFCKGGSIVKEIKKYSITS